MSAKHCICYYYWNSLLNHVLTHGAKIDDTALLTCKSHPLWKKNIWLSGESCHCKACFWRDSSNKKQQRVSALAFWFRVYDIIVHCLRKKRHEIYRCLLISTDCTFHRDSACVIILRLVSLQFCFHARKLARTAHIHSSWHILFALLLLPLPKCGKLGANASCFSHFYFLNGLEWHSRFWQIHVCRYLMQAHLGFCVSFCLFFFFLSFFYFSSSQGFCVRA